MNREKGSADHKTPEEVVDDEIAAEVTDAVSWHLKREYDNLVEEPVPPRFTDLLDQLATLPSPTSLEPALQESPDAIPEPPPTETDDETAEESHPEQSQGA
jgi:hypothetical protein